MLTDLHSESHTNSVLSISSEDAIFPMTLLHPVTLQSAPVILESLSPWTYFPVLQLLNKLPVLM